MSQEEKLENRYVKNSVDYMDYDHKDEIDELTDSDCLDLLDDIELENLRANELCKNSRDSNPLINLPNPIEPIDELAILGFFNEFTLMDIGIGDFIREVYFED